MARRQQALAETILRDEDVANLSSYIGVDGTNTALNVGRLLITLKPHDDRAASASDVIRRLNREVADVVGISLAMQPVQDLTIDSTVSRAQYQFFLQNPSQSELSTWTPRLVRRMQQSPSFEDVSSDLADQGRQLLLTIDRPTAARFGITPATIDNALYDAFGQRIASTYYTQSNQYRVILKATAHLLDNPTEALAGIYLPSATATTGQAPLAAMVQSRRRARRCNSTIWRNCRRNPFRSIWRRACRLKRRWGRSCALRPTSVCRTAFPPPFRAPCRPSRNPCPTS